MYEAQIGYTCIFQAKQHDPLLEKVLLNDESSLLLIFRNHPDLVLVGKGIHKAKVLARCGIHLINFW